MKFHKQWYRHLPPRYIGDCERTVIACMLDLEMHEVPHFGIGWPLSGDEWDKRVQHFLIKRGITQLHMLFPGETPLNDVLFTLNHFNPSIPFILMGMSKTDVNHVVICNGGEIIHDPAINNSGIVGPCDDGFWRVRYLVRLL